MINTHFVFKKSNLMQNIRTLWDPPQLYAGVWFLPQTNKGIRLKRWKLSLWCQALHREHANSCKKRANFVPYCKLIIESLFQAKVSVNMPELYDWSAGPCGVFWEHQGKRICQEGKKVLRRYMKKWSPGIQDKKFTPDFHTEWLRHQSLETKVRKSP